MSRSPYNIGPMTPQKLGLLSAAIPSPAGDVVGLLADAWGYAKEPESLTPASGLLSLAALAPGVPSLAGRKLFHGTYGKATKELASPNGTTWFSEAADHANEYAKGGRRSTRGAKPGARVYPVKADVKNPLDLTDVPLSENSTLDDLAARVGVSPDELAAKIRSYAEKSPGYQKMIQAGLIPSVTGIAHANPAFGMKPGWKETKQWYAWFDSPEVARALKDFGYDGVQAVEHYGNPTKAAMTLGVFDPDAVTPFFGRK